MRKSFLNRCLLSATLALGVSTFANAGGDMQLGKAAVEKYACASCHGADFNTPIQPSYPKLAGQYEDYLYQAMKQYHPSTEQSMLHRNNAIMKGIMGMGITDADMRNMAAYLSKLPGQLKEGHR